MTKAVVEHMYEKHYLSDYQEVESQSATNVTIQSLGLGLFEDTFENAQWRSETNAVIATSYLLVQVL